MKPRLTLEEERQLILDYSGGLYSLLQLAHKYEIPKSTLYRWLKERGIPMRPAGGKYNRTDPYDEQQTVKAYAAGATYKQIGIALRSDPSVVSKILARHGVRRDRRVRTTGLNLAALSPPYSPEKLVLLGVLWASIPSSQKGRSDEMIVRSKNRKQLDDLRLRIGAHGEVKAVSRGQSGKAKEPIKSPAATWTLRLRSTPLARLLKGLDVWKLPHLRSFFTGVLIRLATEKGNGEIVQVELRGREEVIQALSRYLTPVLKNVKVTTKFCGSRSRLTILEMSLANLLDALKDPTPVKAPREASARDAYLATFHKMTVA